MFDIDARIAGATGVIHGTVHAAAANAYAIVASGWKTAGAVCCADLPAVHALPVDAYGVLMRTPYLYSRKYGSWS